MTRLGCPSFYTGSIIAHGKLQSKHLWFKGWEINSPSNCASASTKSYDSTTNIMWIFKPADSASLPSSAQRGWICSKLPMPTIETSISQPLNKSRIQSMTKKPRDWETRAHRRTTGNHWTIPERLIAILPGLYERESHHSWLWNPWSKNELNDEILTTILRQNWPWTAPPNLKDQ